MYCYRVVYVLTTFTTSLYFKYINVVHWYRAESLCMIHPIYYIASAYSYPFFSFLIISFPNATDSWQGLEARWSYGDMEERFFTSGISVCVFVYELVCSCMCVWPLCRQGTALERLIYHRAMLWFCCLLFQGLYQSGTGSNYKSLNNSPAGMHVLTLWYTYIYYFFLILYVCMYVCMYVFSGLCFTW